MGSVKFWDSLSVKSLEVPQAIKDYYANPPASDVKPLRIRIAATHAGKITRNNGFYLPHKMKAGAPSFTAQFNKPVQVHHDSERDPIGRIISARYIDTSGVVKDTWSARKPKDKERKLDLTFLDAFVDGRLTDTETIEVAKKYFIQDVRVSDDPDYQGLGYIEIIADIVDPDAIVRILDGRYLTGSTAATTNHAYCSVCKQDWADDGKCEHRPGQMYDEVKCVLIAGDLAYDEYSFVNKPADRHSRVIEINVNGIQDFVRVGPEAEILDNEVVLMVDAHQSEEEQKMSEQVTTGAEPAKVETPPAPEKSPLQILFGDAYEEIVGPDPEGQKYAEMFLVLLESTEETQREVVTQEIKDAVLSAAARKKLPASVFCGPNRSYPVHDCAHAKAAMAYAKKYNESSSILACIRRKASRLGCPFKEGDAVQTPQDLFGQFVVEYFDAYSDEELIQLKNGVLASIKERKLPCPVMDAAEKVAQLEKALAAKPVDPTPVPDGNLDAARKEIASLHTDVENLTAAVAKAAGETRDANCKHIVTLRTLGGETVDFQKICDELKDKSSDEVVGILKDLTDKVDTKKIAGNLNSGLSNNPTEKVADPTVVQDNLNQDAKANATQQIDEALWAKVRYRWLQIRQARGQEAADKFLQDCKVDGLIPVEWPVKEQA